MDSDTRICLSRIEESFERAKENDAHYVGMISGCETIHCPKDWSYMSGGFRSYLCHSKEVLRKQHGLATVLHEVEDINTGYWANEVHKGKGNDYMLELEEGNCGVERRR